MATDELVTEQFQFLGIDIEKEVLSKCVNLCQEHDIDAETFVEQWMAFSLSNLKGAPPTLDNLDALARKEFSKRDADRLRQNAGNLTVYSSTSTTEPENEIINKYIKGTSKRIKVEPEGINQIELCPVTYSPTQNNSGKYSSRTNAGSVVHSFGDEKLLETCSKSNGPNDIVEFSVSQVPNDNGELFTKAMYGFELLHEKASNFDNHISYLTQYIFKKIGVSEAASVKHKTQTDAHVSGRIECDADARLNAKSVVLQGTWQHSLSQTVPLELDSVKQYSLFPGQVAVVHGSNPRGDKFIAKEVFCDASAPIPDHKADLLNKLNSTITMIMTAGPYTTSDNMLYEPLKDLTAYITTHKPHLVIMTGPFMDSDHCKIKDNSMAESYRSFFEKLLDSLGDLSNNCPFTKIYIASSAKDVFHNNVYPTAAYSSRKKHGNIYFLPDPCTLNIGGVIVGITSTDILLHISQEEISLGCGGDKLSRLAGHLLSQQCYYPLWPSQHVNLDSSLWSAHAQMSSTPHILMVPSNFRYFVKNVNGCIVVNPERLTKGAGGGTFARIAISPDKENFIAAQILRI